MSESPCSNRVTARNSDCKNIDCWQSAPVTTLQHICFFSAVMTDEQKARLSTKRPLTKEEYEARQSVIRKVVDPETGRTR